MDLIWYIGVFCYAFTSLNDHILHCRSHQQHCKSLYLQSVLDPENPPAIHKALQLHSQFRPRIEEALVACTVNYLHCFLV